jgi:pyridoxamine 5'-phosphate oxidase
MNPHVQFESWYKAWLDRATALQFPEPTAVALATASPSGMPSVRMVLLKAHTETGFRFFTHSTSQKGLELEQNPQASLLFYWPGFMQQIRVTGHVRVISREETTKYFHSRPRDSQIGAVASKQSRPNHGTADFRARVDEVCVRFEGKPIPCPESWNGYELTPAEFEFWQGHEFRFHERNSAKLTSDRTKWIWQTLDP